jgi:metal-responsive CopG/Arc/MetJ family transcriptional regulator
MTATKFSISLPSELLARADQVLAKPGEGRSALLARILEQAVRAAEDAEIDAEYERAYTNRPLSAEERRVLNGMTQAGIEGLARHLAERRG